MRVVYSPLDAVDLARRNPDRQIVFFAVGFETTAPANAVAVSQARQERLRNFSALVSHALVPPALELLLSSPENRIDGILAAGHVCTVMGFTEYIPISRKYRIPIVVTGFEPLDILNGIRDCILQLERGAFSVQNSYSRAVRQAGNQEAQAIVREVFEIVPRKWRGIGEIPRSGLGLRKPYQFFDAEKRFAVDEIEVFEPEGCLSGLVLRGMTKPYECPSFGTTCTPEHPLGATMVSSEGACAAYYEYRQQKGTEN